MSIRHINFILTSAILAISLLGCGKANDKSPAVSAAGKHPSDWYTAHRNAYILVYFSDGALQCKECHGSDLKGGITEVNCFKGIDNFPGGNCHATGHGPRVAHTLPFKAATLHAPAARADISWCGACHATGTTPGSNPSYNISIGLLTNGCEDCHKIGTAHPPVDPAKISGYPSNWNGHASAGNLANSCSLCHGIDYGGGSGPACRSCHTNLPLYVLPVAGLCTSCHAKPPALAAHTAHNNVVGITGLCAACHVGAGNGTPRHGSRGFGNATTAISPNFNARTGPGRVTASLTCTNVSCHGGVPTPPWGTGSIDVTNQCTACHLAGSASQTPQYNSYFSGEHTRHINIGLACTDCHDMSVTNSVNSHFSNLATPVFELAPSLTIRSQVHYTGGSCSPGANPPNGTFSFGVCHGPKSW